MKSSFQKHNLRTWHWHYNFNFWIGAKRLLEKSSSNIPYLFHLIYVNQEQKED